MASNEWSITVGGAPATLTVGQDSVSASAGGETTSWSRNSVEVSFPTSFSVLLAGDGGEVAVGFRSTAEQGEFREAMSHKASNVPAANIHLSSLLQPIGREIVASLGLVRAHAVMSRNVVSDAGSDLMSFFGGSLGGIEAAIESALRDAEQRLRRNAAQLGADHVLNVVIALETVSDKAQAILISGTAVETRASTSTRIEEAPAVDS